MIERPPSPGLPTNADDEDAIDGEDLAMLQTIRQYAEEHDLDGLEEEKMRMAHYRVTPDDVVLVEDDNTDTGYRVLLTEEYLEDREDLATAEERMSKALRRDYGFDVDAVAKMGPVEMAQALVDAVKDDGGDPR